jgi:regulator of sigma E protease
MFIFTLLVFIILIGLLVLVHEWGHYRAALAVGIKVEEFAIGMGPKIFGWKKNNIDFSIRALPIGGYVKMYGEGDYDIKSPDSFAGKTPSKRLIVLLAGVTMNFLLAVVLLYAQGANQNFQYRNIEGLFDSEYRPWFGHKSESQVAIREVSDTSPLKDKVSTYDIITKVNGNDYELKDFLSLIESNKGNEITLDVVGYASSDVRQISVTPRTEIPEGEGPLGVQIGLVSFTSFTGIGKVFAGFGQGMNTIQNFVFSIGEIFKMSMQQSTIVPVADSFGGAISIFDVLNKIMLAFGFWGVLELAALFSINLAVFNILPIPALDGGHVLFTLGELITRRRLPTALYNYLTLAGFVLLIGFMFVVTGLDLVKHTRLRDLFCNDSVKVGFVCDLSDLRE